jgi:hypothetical protein
MYILVGNAIISVANTTIVSYNASSILVRFENLRFSNALKNALAYYNAYSL